MFDLRVVVEEVRGFCDLPMRSGDYFEVRGGRIIVPEGKHICLWALSAMLPMFPAKQRKIDEENDWLPSTQHMCCPDPNGMVIYRIDRIADDSSNTQQAVKKVEQERNKPFPRMLVDEKVCTGCRSCELACSFHKKGFFLAEEARVRVMKDEENGLDRPQVCRQCGNARCVQACPEGALERHPETHAIILNAELCVGCAACAEACPFGSIHFKEQQPVICDLCGGDPRCIERCATGALRFGRAGEAALKGGARAVMKGGQ
ncbi:TIGR04076 family protein [Desulforamulus aeronauticus]|uniref:TIGR04076 family protein n=1 Tax=Desulforamulus aeronauticus DSM 10349 TaxID=1121421 RepID=A0A1M6TM84_9FIRM|nr:TIGR04076 family protein [Desulforamulus aeronauticus]SHK57979.1 TIGR04076 family protein [Desulforamulus aeronauticus DSM 10349]